VESLHDCGYLFSQFKANLKKTGHAGIIAIHFAQGEIRAEEVSLSVALFIKAVDKKLSGRIEGGYKAGARDFFLLVVPDGRYDEETFRLDKEVIRSELGGYCTHAHLSRRMVASCDSVEIAVAVDGVFLTDRLGENADNALFRAFQELFGATPEGTETQSRERDEIGAIIRRELITPVYQPIFSLSDGLVNGYEALSRITAPGCTLSTEELFTAAKKHGLAAPLEMLCRKKALLGVREQGIPSRIFLNLCPSLLLAGIHERGITAALLDELGIERSRIVFELTERTLITDYELFSRAVAHYREQGYSIAIDDLGSGYAGLKMLAQLEPEYVKLSRFLIAGIDRSPTKQALVEAIVMFCSRIGATIIAEGIERPGELDFLVTAKVALGQGYLLARPAAGPIPPGAAGKYSRNFVLPATQT
jgi:EAL domain-containing protein (putative c-di-GMP-specific phosphodiesterase class I)